MSQRAKIVLGQPEIDRLKRKESLVVKLKPDTSEIEIKASMLVHWNSYSEGSIESMIQALKFR